MGSYQNLSDFGCAKDKFSIVVHGWLETCEREWIPVLRENLKASGRKCFICFDYSHYGKNLNYFGLANQFWDIKGILVGTLRLMDQEGFKFEDGFMFGFSFGGHLALESAIDLGEKRFKMIDSKFFIKLRFQYS